MHVFAANADVEFAGQIPLESNPSAELHPSSTHRRGHIVETHTGGIEPNGPVDGIERIGQRKMTDAPSGDRGASGKDRFVERTVDPGRQRRPTGTAHVAEKSLKDPQIRVT